MAKRPSIDGLPVEPFTLREVVGLVGGDPGRMKTRLDVWCRQGWIVPAKAARSKGDDRLFSGLNTMEVAFALVLIEGGISQSGLGRAFAAHRHKWAGPDEVANLRAVYKACLDCADAVRAIWMKSDDPEYAEWRATAHYRMGRTPELLSLLATLRCRPAFRANQKAEGHS
jgi:hypothetical protein